MMINFSDSICSTCVLTTYFCLTANRFGNLQKDDVFKQIDKREARNSIYGTLNPHPDYCNYHVVVVESYR